MRVIKALGAIFLFSIILIWGISFLGLTLLSGVQGGTRGSLEQMSPDPKYKNLDEYLRARGEYY